MARSVDDLPHAGKTPSFTDAPSAPCGGLVAFIDVDDTLVRSVGSKRIPMTEVIRCVRELHSGGAKLYCWSTGGATYAYDTACELAMTQCFVGFLDKPHLLVDDQPPSDWRQLICLHPNELASMSVDELRAVRGRRAG